jgi:hypothetical protein
MRLGIAVKAPGPGQIVENKKRKLYPERNEE